MGQKKTPQLVAAAKRLRAAGRSNREIADELSKKGKKLSEGTIRNWLGTPTPPARPTRSPRPPAPVSPAQPPPAPETAPTAAREAADETDMPPAEFEGWLTKQLRQLQADAAMARAAEDHNGARQNTRLAAQIAALLQKQRARQEDEGDAVKVRADDLRAAADRAILALHQLAERVIAERATWPKCEACGQHVGEFAPTDKSPLRALVERLFGRVPS